MAEKSEVVIRQENMVCFCISKAQEDLSLYRSSFWLVICSNFHYQLGAHFLLYLFVKGKGQSNLLKKKEGILFVSGAESKKERTFGTYKVPSEHMVLNIP